MDKIRSLEYELEEKENAMRSQSNNYEKMLASMQKQKDSLNEEIEIYKENERHFQITKKQNQQLKERMEDYQDLDGKCKEYKEDNKKLSETIQLLKVELSHAK